jgi:hypothetical protein
LHQRLLAVLIKNRESHESTRMKFIAFHSREFA